MTAKWTIKGYTNASGKNLINRWYGKLSSSARAKFVVRVKYLVARERNDWRRPHFARLSGECKGLGEIRFKADGVQHRPIGYFGPAMFEYTILVRATEKDSSFKPKNACRTAQERKDEVKKDAARATRCSFSPA